jgi:alpha-D-xyloside xylohydrolase
MRALLMEFPGDINVLPIADQYMFGPAFLVCPVTELHSTTRKAYLPSGTRWANFWTGETRAGGKTVTANALLTIMPLYVRAGSIVPLRPVMQYATGKPADLIELRVYTGGKGGFTLYEDEGEN